jgi:hypothetical protein
VAIEQGAAIEQAGERIGGGIGAVAGRHPPLMQCKRQGADTGHIGDADGKAQILGPIVRRYTQHQLATVDQHAGAEQEGDGCQAIEKGDAGQRQGGFRSGLPILVGGGKAENRRWRCCRS